MHICYDGLNLAAKRGTGIATYTRMLARVTREAGHKVGVAYSTPLPPAKNPAMREISFYDPDYAAPVSRVRQAWLDVSDHLRCCLSLKATAMVPSGLVISDNEQVPAYDCGFTTRNLFVNANWYFEATGRFLNLRFASTPDILHCTYQMPLRCKGARSVFTIHDLVPLRLPHTTLDNKRFMYRLLRTITDTADHIVTVSENSKQDIMTFLGVDEKRITNTYQSVEFPQEHIDRPVEALAETLEGSFGLEYRKYLLFYAALEPKKNVTRLIDAYFSSGIDLPLVMVASGGWSNEAEATLLRTRQEQQRADRTLKRRIVRLDYASVPLLATIVRGACAVVFPSLYEGFGLPVLEAMVLGTPVVTSNVSSLPEIAGDAALLVDPYDVADIARAIRTIASDGDLRDELVRRGRARAQIFSVDRYRERVARLYESLR